MYARIFSAVAIGVMMALSACVPHRPVAPWPEARYIEMPEPPGYPALPAISPDNRKLVVFRQGDGVNMIGSVYVLNITTSVWTRLQVGETPYSVGDVTWLPDSQQFALDVNNRLALVDVNSSTITYVGSPSMSFIPTSGPTPDELTGYILVPASRKPAESERIDVFSMSTKAYSGLLAVDWLKPNYYGGMEWSPNGRYLAISANGYEGSRGSNDILVYDKVEDSIRVLAATEWRETRPHWSPDGNWLGFVVSQYATMESGLVIMSLDGKCVVRQVVTQGLLTDMDWGDDGDLVVVFDKHLFSVNFANSFGYSVDGLADQCEP